MTIVFLRSIQKAGTSMFGAGGGVAKAKLLRDSGTLYAVGHTWTTTEE